MSRFRIALVSLALAACGLDLVGVGVASGPDAGPLLDASTDAPSQPVRDAEPIFDASDADAAVPDPRAELLTTVPGLRTVGRVADTLYVGSPATLKRVALVPGQPVGEIAALSDVRAVSSDATRLLYVTGERAGILRPPDGLDSQNGLPPGSDILFTGDQRTVSSHGDQIHSFDVNHFDGDMAGTFPGSQILGLAFGTPYVYWADRAHDAVYRVTGGVPAAPFVTGVTAPTSVAVDATHLFIARAGEVSYVALATPAALVTLAVSPIPIALAVDGTFVYWIEASTGALRRVPMPSSISGAAETLANGTGALPAMVYTRLITFDATYVYWGDPASGRLNRTRK